MLLSKFKKLYSHRPSGPNKNRIGLIKGHGGGSRMSERNSIIILKSSSIRRAQIRIYPSENLGGIVVN